MHSKMVEIVPKDQLKGREGYAKPTGAMQRARVTAQRGQRACMGGVEGQRASAEHKWADAMAKRADAEP